MLASRDEQKIFSFHSKSNSIVTETQFLMLPNLYRGRLAPREYGIEKSPSTHFCDRRFWYVRRMTFLFVFADGYDPKEAHKHTF